MTAINSKTSLVLACGIALLALPAFAANHTGKHAGGDMFKSADANTDGKVTRAEHAASSKKMFTDMDVNRDGSVSAVEMSAVHGKTHAEIVDSTLKQDGTSSGMRQDGSASAKQGGTASANQGGSVGMRHDGSSMMKREGSSAEMFKQHDQNQDGKVSSAEHEAACDAMFTKMDKNSDGTLSADECKDGEKMMSK